MGFVLLCNILGATPALFFPVDTTWIEKPWFYPPEILFPIVWTLLFTLMGIALFLVWQQGISEPPGLYAVIAFIVQFGLNISWTPVFFGLLRPDLALVIIGLLWISILITIWAFYQVSRIAAGLLIPYLLWVTFAIILNFSIAFP